MQPPPEVMEPLAPGERFRFSCHRSIRCFTDCCRDLNLMLTPYDVLRLKQALRMDSTDFLDRHTLRSTDPDWNVPVLKLKMEEAPSLRCPFVVEAGCRIYPDRPGACRAYPLGRATRQARGRSSSPSSLQEKFFLVKETHCHGFLEDREWTPEAWIQDQGMAEYNERNDRWMTFLTRYRPGTGRELSSKQWQMFFMAWYSLDRFRVFVFGTRFLSLFEITEDRQKLLRQNDEALLEFSFLWLAFSLFNDPVLKMRPPGRG